MFSYCQQCHKNSSNKQGLKCLQNVTCVGKSLLFLYSLIVNSHEAFLEQSRF